MPVSVAGIAVRQGLVFVARRKPGGVLGGRWEFPGGKCEYGETPQKALIREYIEELGIVVRPGPCLGTTEFQNNGAVFQLSAYAIDFDGEPLTMDEHDEVCWVDRTALESLDFVPSDRLLFPFLPI